MKLFDNVRLINNIGVPEYLDLHSGDSSIICQTLADRDALDVTSIDLYKVVYVVDIDTEFRLMNKAPVAWKELAGDGSSGGLTITEVNNLIDSKNFATVSALDTDVTTLDNKINTKVDSNANDGKLYGRRDATWEEIEVSGLVDLSNYYTKLEVDTLLSSSVTDSELTTALSNYYTINQSYTRTEIDTKIDNMATGGVVDLNNYYTKSETDSLISGITVDLSDYYDKAETDTKISNSLLNYYNKTEIDDKIDDFIAGNVDLSNYFNKDEINTLLGSYTTDTELNNSLLNYYSKIEIDNKLSSLNPTVDLSDYYTKTEIDTDFYTKSVVYNKTEVDGLIDSVDVDLSNYYDKTTIDTKLDALVTGGTVDLSNYYTKAQTDALIDSIDLNVDLSNYYTKANVDTLLSNYLQDAPNDTKLYGRQNNIWAEIDISSLVDLSTYYTKTEVNNLLVNKLSDSPNDNKLYGRKNAAWEEITVSGTVDLTNYYTKTEVDTKVQALNNSLVTKLSDAPSDGKLYGRASGSWAEITNTGSSVDLSNYYTMIQVDNLVNDVYVDMYDKSDVDTLLTSYYTKTEVDAKLDSISAGDVDLSNYYTKAETYNASELDDAFQSLDTDLANKVDKNPLDLKLYLRQNNSWVELEDVDLSDYYTKSEIDTKLSVINNSIANIIERITVLEGFHSGDVEEPDTISDFSVFSTINPVVNDTPITNISNAQFNGLVSWSPAIVDDRFSEETAYTATISILPKTGYTIDSIDPNISIPNVSSVSYSSGVFTVVFNATESAPANDDNTYTGYITMNWSDPKMDPGQGFYRFDATNIPDYDGPQIMIYDFIDDPTFSTLNYTNDIAAIKFYRSTVSGNAQWNNGDDGIILPPVSANNSDYAVWVDGFGGQNNDGETFGMMPIFITPSAGSRVEIKVVIDKTKLYSVVNS